jgi:hypothetical protein
MSLYWSVNKNMEIIKNITEVSDVYFNDDKWNTYDGYCIETDSRQLYFVINNGQDCCENWGYLSSEDDFGSFIGSELKNVYVTDTKLGTIVSNMKEDLDAGSAMFINDENLTKLIEAMVCACQEDEDVTIRQNALQCIYELTNKILDMQVKDKYLNPIVVDINQK